jgi:hypothetical protein
MNQDNLSAEMRQMEEQYVVLQARFFIILTTIDPQSDSHHTTSEKCNGVRIIPVINI